MDEKYEQFLSIQPLLFQAASLRKSSYYKNMLRETYKAEIAKLRNVEIELQDPKLKLDDLQKWPVSSDLTVPHVDLKQLLHEYKNIYAAVDNLKQG